MADASCPQWCENSHSSDDTVHARRRTHIATVGRVDLPTGRIAVLVTAGDRWSHGEWTPYGDPTIAIRYTDDNDTLRDLTGLDADQAQALAGILDGTNNNGLVGSLRQAVATLEGAGQ